MPLSTAAKDYVLGLFRAYPQPAHLYHSYQHTCEVVRLCAEIGAAEQLADADLDLLLTAAWWHDVGYLLAYEEHETRSQNMVRDWLATRQATPSTQKIVHNCIEATRLGAKPAGILAEILADADLAYSVGGDAFALRATLLRMEWQLVLGKKYSNKEWRATQIKFLREHCQFFTAYAREHFAPQAAQYLVEQLEDEEEHAKEKAKKQQDKSEKEAAKAEKRAEKAAKKMALAALPPYQRLETSPPTRGVQTFFRSVYPNHLELSSIADNKANMMISINSIVLTLIVAMFSVSVGSAQDLKNSAYVLPIAMFIATALISLVIAVLSVMPKVTKINKKQMQRAELARNMVFFGNFVDLSPQEYEQIMQEVLTDSELLYGNMTRDLYYLGKVLQQKYKLLSLAYRVFLIGLTLSVAAFLVVVFV